MSIKISQAALIFWLLATHSYAQILSTSDLPIIIINTQGQAIPNEPKIVASMSIIDNGAGKRNALSDKPAYSGKIGIEQRGSTSRQLFPKKPYGFELRDSSGVNSVNASILGMPAESDWVLNATYNDKTLLRDVMTYQIYRQISRFYASRYRFCEVIINDQYQGIYIVMEKIKRDKNRVDIANIKPEDISGDQVTGGYILKIDKTEGSLSRTWTSPYRSSSNYSIPIQIDRPKIEDLKEAQFQYIKKYVTDFENALNSTSFSDSTTGFRKYINEESFIDYLILTEVCKNVDGYRLSTYFYKDRDSKNGGKLTMGPIWDYNLTYGNADYCDGNSYIGWAYNFNRVCTSDALSIPFWWDKLLQDKTFAKKVKTKYQSLRQTTLKPERLSAYVDSMATLLEEGRARNFQKWPVLGVYVWPNGFVGRTYPDETNYLKDWIRQRLLWLDGAIQPFGADILAVEPDPDETLALTVGPNPMAERLTLRYRLDQRADVQLAFTNTDGRLIRTISLPDQSAGEHQQTLESPDLPTEPGVYILNLTTNGRVKASRKLVRQ